MILSLSIASETVAAGIEGGGERGGGRVDICSSGRQLSAPCERYHASRRGCGSMGGYASAGPQSDRLSAQQSQRQTTTTDKQQIDEESSQYNEAIKPHKTWFDDQYCCQQTCRYL